MICNAIWETCAWYKFNLDLYELFDTSTSELYLTCNTVLDFEPIKVFFFKSRVTRKNHSNSYWTVDNFSIKHTVEIFTREHNTKHIVELATIEHITIHKLVHGATTCARVGQSHFKSSQLRCFRDNDDFVAERSWYCDSCKSNKAYLIARIMFVHL